VSEISSRHPPPCPCSSCAPPARAFPPSQAGSQFFVCLGPLKSLDNKYTTFGKMIKGDEVLKALGSAKTAKGDYPVSLPAPSEPPARHRTRAVLGPSVVPGTG